MTYFEKAIEHYCSEPIELDKAIEYFEKSVIEENDVVAAEILIHIYNDNIKSDDLKEKWTNKYLELVDDNEKGIYFLNNKNYEEAIFYFKRSAENGKPHSMYRLGSYYDKGSYVEKDVNKAFEYFEKAAALEHKESLFACALYYNDGKIGGIPNYEKAFHYAEKAAKLNDEQALYLLGHYYENGIFVKKDIEKAYEFYLKSSDLQFEFALPFRYFEDSVSHWEDHIAYETIENVKSWINKERHEGIKIEEMEWYNNDLDSAFYVGLLYYHDGNLNYYDKNVAYDENVTEYEEALVYFKQAADLGHAAASYYIGVLYDWGLIGDDYDIEKSLPYMMKASELGFVPADYYIGNYYENGFDCIPRNYEKSFEYYSKAALKGFPIVFGSMTEAYLYGIGVNKDMEKAFFWALKGAELYDYKSIKYLVKFYSEGLNGKQDLVKAEYWKGQLQQIDSPQYLYVMGEPENY